MLRHWCNTEDYGGGEAHYAARLSFDWVTVQGKTIWACEDCRHELKEEE